ncbi:hypothetical protein GQX73_g10285 [Xylaria multiplex]|uniref:Tyrosine specific protein phosphatases domain-containing protein n=1 Tax=Xylaria multiplex TaxID=323545 RepID=A0A7C8ML08_9PEZI|nr:hypothetical protein GQX73_g10285 [Xylaria multiplex]
MGQPSFPPGTGDDILGEGMAFFISLLGTDQVATAENQDVYFRPFSGNDAQTWFCERHPNNRRLGLRNVATRGLLSRNDGGNISNFAGNIGEAQSFFQSRHLLGGIQLEQSFDDMVNFVGRAGNLVGEYLQVVPDEIRSVRLDVHTTEDSLPPFRRLEWVIPGQLARSSAPHYQNQDSDQRMDLSALQWLAAQGIHHVISVNEEVLDWTAQEGLLQRDITYFHSRIPDFGTPTLDQLQQIHESQQNQRATLVYCGYGHGRTGTVISALQILRGRRFRSRADFERNHVETSGQLQVLRQLHKKVFGNYPY